MIHIFHKLSEGAFKFSFPWTFWIPTLQILTYHNEKKNACLTIPEELFQNLPQCFFQKQIWRTSFQAVGNLIKSLGLTPRRGVRWRQHLKVGPDRVPDHTGKASIPSILHVTRATAQAQDEGQAKSFSTLLKTNRCWQSPFSSDDLSTSYPMTFKNTNVGDQTFKSSIFSLWQMQTHEFSPALLPSWDATATFY